MFILEGNIGAGKSTLIAALKKSLPEINFCQEPVENWQKTDLGDSLLSEFYQDTKRWSYAMESFTLMCRVKEMANQLIGKTVVERSVFSGFYCFAKNGYLNGSMSKLEWEVYNQWFKFFSSCSLKFPLGFIYLKTSPEVCYKRILKRDRQGESQITLKYLQDISSMHDKMLLQKKEILPQLQDVPVLVLDADIEFQDNLSDLNFFVKAIKNFVEKNSVLPIKIIP